MISVGHCVESFALSFSNLMSFSCLDICGTTAVKGARDSLSLRDTHFHSILMKPDKGLGRQSARKAFASPLAEGKRGSTFILGKDAEYNTKS